MPITKKQFTAHANPESKTNSHTLTQGPYGPFDFQRLDAYQVSRQTLVMGEAIARNLPRGYSKLQDQLRRALLAAHLGIAEASSRCGTDRKARFRCARGEAAEAAAALDAIILLKLAPKQDVQPVIQLLSRLCAMLTRLAGFRK